MNWQRQSVVAGTFYPKDKADLLGMLEDYYTAEGDKIPQKKTPRAIIAPHAGYIYSGAIAGSVYRRVTVPETVIVLCPNHTGYGKRISVWNCGEWLTPLGRALVDEELANDFLDKASESSGDQEAHVAEHAVEVQLPFIQYSNPKARVVPIVLGALRVEQCQVVAQALASAIQGRPEGSVMMVASTDMSHYVPAKLAKERDSLALQKIELLDGPGLYQTVIEKDISMCGFIPTVAVLDAAARLGATRAEIIRYGHSGEVTGDSRSVVAYLSAMVF